MLARPQRIEKKNRWHENDRAPVHQEMDAETAASRRSTQPLEETDLRNGSVVKC